MGDYFVGFSEAKGRSNVMGYPSSPSSIPRTRSVEFHEKRGDHHTDDHHHRNKRHHERHLPVGVPGKPPGDARPCSSDYHKPPMSPTTTCPMIKFSERVEDLAEHFKLSKSVSDTLKGKLSLGAEIVTKGGLENLFRELFTVDSEEKLLKSFACYLCTTADPVAGVMFISTQKLAFCSERRLAFSSPSGGLARSYYRVVIPVREVRSVNSCENSETHSEKYIDVQTVDKSEFWFMGFVNFHKALKYVKKAVESG